MYDVLLGVREPCAGASLFGRADPQSMVGEGKYDMS
jgi:hypothetical protein